MSALAFLRIVPGWCWGLLLIVAAVLGAEVHGRHAGEVKVQAQWNVAKLAQAQADQKAEADNRAKEQAYAKQLEDAQNAATKRETVIRADADAARQSADSLRNQLADAKRAMSAASADAVRNYTDALTDVFSQCAARYTSLARNADECESDRQTLEQAWPK